MAGGASGDEESLLYSPSWTIALVCAGFIAVSLLAERGIHYVGWFLKKREQIALENAFEKIKEELMMLGFISLALTAGQTQVSKICMPEKWSTIMNTCEKPDPGTLLRGSCAKGKVPFVSLEGLHQLHIYLFVLAVVHVVYSVVTMALGRAKVHRWEAWEEDSRQLERTSHDTLRYTRENSFVQMHAEGVWSRNVFLSYLAASFQQFYHSVNKTDYVILRHGFIETHMAANADFDFYKYILRSLEQDFEHVVGISPALWGYTVLLMMLNVHGWRTHLWTSLVTFIIVLAIGTKLRHIISKMAVQITEKHAVIEGMPTVMLDDNLFWFKRPRFIISLLHLVLFQNASALSYFLWIKTSLRNDICLYDERYLTIAGFIIGIVGQAICSYITLPIHALVSQMGSGLKKSVFKHQTQLALTNWTKKAKEKVQLSKKDRFKELGKEFGSYQEANLEGDTTS